MVGPGPRCWDRVRAQVRVQRSARRPQCCGQRPFAASLHGGPRSDRIFHSNVWFRGHNNRRYAARLPRLARVDSYLIVCSGRKLLRGVEFRALRATGPPRDRVLLAAATKRYRFGFMVALKQVEHCRGSVIADVDDPLFSPREAQLLVAAVERLALDTALRARFAGRVTGRAFLGDAGRAATSGRCSTPSSADAARRLPGGSGAGRGPVASAR